MERCISDFAADTIGHWQAPMEILQFDPEALVLTSMRYGSNLLGRRWSSRRSLATAAPSIPQTYIEKIVQKYAVGLPPGKVVKSGDYVMIQPEHVMTHDNTGPVISKSVYLSPT